MQTRTRFVFRGIFSGAAWLAMLAAGCAGDIYTVGGESVGAPQTNISITVPAPEPTRLTLLEQPTAAIREQVACRIPASWGYPHLLEDPMQARAIAGVERVCLDERGEAEAFCRWTERFDVRQRAVSSCQQSAVQRLHELGRARLGAARWARVARELPAEWQPAAEPREAVMLGTWVTMLLTGERQDQAPASPFCLPANLSVEPEEQLWGALRALRWGWETLAAHERETLDALAGGIGIELAGRRLELRVAIDEQAVQAAADAPGCVFRVGRD